jgi:hypothetical protein
MKRTEQILFNLKDNGICVLLGGGLLVGLVVATPFVLGYLTHRTAIKGFTTFKNKAYGPWLEAQTQKRNPLEEKCLRCIEGRNNDGDLEVLRVEEDNYLLELEAQDLGIKLDDNYRTFIKTGRKLKVNIAGLLKGQGEVYAKSDHFSFVPAFPLTERKSPDTDERESFIDSGYRWRRYFDYQPIPSEQRECLANKINQAHGETIRRAYGLSEDVQLELRA